MFFAGKKRRPIWQPSKLEKLRRALCDITISWKGLLAALLILLLAGVVIPELFRSVVLVDPISVPKSFEDQGFTGQVVAAAITDQTASMEEAVKTAAPKDQVRLASDTDVPDIEVPETKLPMRPVVHLLQVFLRRQPPHIHADIVCLVPGCTSPAAPGDVSPERLVVIYRFTDGKTLLVHKRFKATDIDDAVAKLSKEILSQVNPYVMALYTFEVDHDTATALQSLELCANNKDYPLRHWAFHAWGNVLQSEGKLDEAIVKYQKAIDLDPKFAFSYYGWGNVLQMQGKGKFDEAIAKYQKAIELDPRYAFAYNGWGNVLRHQRKLDDAIAKYQKAIELDPKGAFPYNGWGNVLQDQSKFDEAIGKYQKAIELDPKYAPPYNGWGNALRRQGKPDEAIVKFQEAIELDSKDAAAYKNWALALIQQGKFDQARAENQKADELESLATHTR